MMGSVWVGPWSGSKFSVKLKIEFQGFFKQREQFDANCCLNLCTLDVAHLSVNLVSEIAVPFPTLMHPFNSNLMMSQSLG